MKYSKIFSLTYLSFITMLSMAIGRIKQKQLSKVRSMVKAA
jgi:hypothetical protein